MRWLLELSILALAAWALFRRPRVANAPFGRPLLLIAGALVAQSLLAWVGVPEGDPATWTLQGARALLLLGAVAAWLAIVRTLPNAKKLLLFLIIDQ